MIRFEHRGSPIVIEQDGTVRFDGDALVLDAQAIRRLRLVVDRDVLATFGSIVGVGPVTSTLTAFDVTLTIRHRGLVASMPRSVIAPVETLLSLTDVFQRRLSLDAWLARLPTPIETEGPVIRFHTYEPRVHDASNRDRWTSLFADGRCLRFDDASSTKRGRPLDTFEVSRDVVQRIATLVAQLGTSRSVQGTIEHDEDRNISLDVQVPDAKTGTLLMSHWSWSFYAPAERACRARIDESFAPGEHAKVYALYERLVALASRAV